MRMGTSGALKVATLLQLLFLVVWVASPVKAQVPVEVIDAVRLVNGQTCCDGRLEVLSGGQWKQACSVNSDVFDLNLARVVCRQLGCSTIGAAKSKIHLYDPLPDTSSAFIINIDCARNDSNVQECPTLPNKPDSCLNEADYISMVCGAPTKDTITAVSDVRLEGGGHCCEGRVELFDSSAGQWTQACRANYSLSDTEVICRQLGCATRGIEILRGQAESFPPLPPSTSMAVDFRYQCSGEEQYLEECRLDSEPMSCFCPAYNYMAIRCQASLNNASIKVSDVRLEGGGHCCEGRVELFDSSAGQWMQACRANYSLSDAEVVCRQLGCATRGIEIESEAESTFPLVQEDTPPRVDIQMQCVGSEASILECGGFSTQAQCGCTGASSVMGLRCGTAPPKVMDVRLTGGEDGEMCAGVLEVRLRGMGGEEEGGEDGEGEEEGEEEGEDGEGGGEGEEGEGEEEREEGGDHRWMFACSESFSVREAQVVCRQLKCSDDGGNPSVQVLSPFKTEFATCPSVERTVPFSAVCSGDEPDLAGCGRPLEPDMCLPHCGVENTIAIICPSSSAKDHSQSLLLALVMVALSISLTAQENSF